MTRRPHTESPETEKPFGPLALWAGLTVLAVAATTYFSSQPGDESGEVSGGVLRAVLFCLGIRDLSAIPLETLSLYDFLLRKAAHFTLYAVLGCGLAGLFLRQRRFPAFYCVLPVAAAYAAVDELHQSLVQGRTASAQDVALDSCGAAAGCALVLFCAAWFRRHNSKRRE